MNQNIEEEMQAGANVGETFAANVSRIKVELYKTIDMIEKQEIVAPSIMLDQENANGDVELHAEIN
jgi:hypothetical protein